MTEISQGLTSAPRIRFSGFSENWKLNSIGNVIYDMRGGASLKPSDFVSKSTSGVIPKKAIQSGGRLKLGAERTYCSDVFFQANPSNQIDRSYLVTTLRDLVPSGPTIGFIVKFDKPERYILAQGVYGFKVRSELLEKEFLTAFSNKNSYRRIMQRLMVGSTQVHIRNGDFKSVPIAIPSIPEQKKIVAFLSAVDTKLESLNAQISGWHEFKLGMMQALFTQTFRFKADDGSNFPEWILERLDSVADVSDGTHQTPKYVSEGVPFYSVEHLTANQFTETKFIEESVYKKEKPSRIPNYDDVLVTRIGDIGTARHIDWEVKAAIYVSLALLKPKADILGQYLACVINAEITQRRIHARSIHVAFPKKINLGDLGAVLVPVPSLPEQQKIADALSAIDAKIEALTQRLEATREFKRGLLQKMFV